MKSGQINQKRNAEKRITNIEQGIMNVEVRYSILIIIDPVSLENVEPELAIKSR